jgi:hypothetical protein
MKSPNKRYSWLLLLPNQVCTKIFVQSTAKIGNVLDASAYRYEITTAKGLSRRIAPASEIKRSKSQYTREKSKLFLKQNTESGSRSIKIKVL